MAIADYLPQGLASYVRDWLAHPNRRPWRFEEAHKQINVPNLDVTGWFDHCNATIGHLAGMQAHAQTEVARTQTKLIIGPWNHTLRGQRSQGDHDFGPRAEVDIDGLTLRWFDHWLKGLRNGIDSEPAVRYYVLGRDRWEACSTWPPKGTRPVSLYLGGRGNAGWPEQAGTLREEAPGSEGIDRFVYDPRDPVPTVWTRDLMTLPVDRRCLEHRDDILYFRTPPLDEDLQIAGHPKLILYAASSAIDTDFFAHLVDEDPKGMALEVSYGMVRARHRASLDREEFLTAGQVVEFRIEMGPTAVCFRRGHRIRLEITSSNFPNHDRNHNVGRNDLADAELRTATQEVVHSPKHPSRLELPGVS
jgi:putative CocE/NonD family hydrolase